MSHLSLRENSYRRKHLAYVRHITLDPTGPGVVRIHMIPPHSQSPEDPYLLLLNGAQLVPLNFSWAVLLSEFMFCMEPYAGVEISADDWESMLEQAVRGAKKKVYPFVKTEILREDMGTLLRSLVAIARGQEPEVEVAPLSLGEYADKMSAPHRMDLMVSAMTRDGLWHCNQKCLHCYAAGQPMGEVKELDTAQWKELLQRLQAANIPQVTFTGGEPTLRSDLVELVNAAQWFVTRLNTNGRRLTADLCKALYEASLDSVQVTLYSDKAAVHNALVGVDGFGDTVAGIKNAVESGLIVSINTPLCSVNRDYADTLRFAASLGVRYATCSGLIPSGGAITEGSVATRLSQAELTDILRTAVETAHSLGMELDFTSPGWLPEETLRSLGLQLIPSCGACLSNMAVTPDGTVVPCQSWLGGVTLGNVLTDPWEKIWTNPQCAAIRAESAKMEHLCQLQAGNRKEAEA